MSCATPGTVVYFTIWKQHFASTLVDYSNVVIYAVKYHGCPGLYERITQCISLLRMFGLPDQSALLQVEFGSRKSTMEGNTAEKQKELKKLKKGNPKWK